MSDSASAVRKLTGKPTRIVWAQQQQGTTDFATVGPDFKLMGLCTEDGKGVRAILPETGSYGSPRLTPNGDRVIFTDNTDKTVYIVNWDGTGRRVLCRGYAMAAWKHPDTGVEYVFTRPNTTKTWASKSRPVVRRPIDNPEEKETMWDASSITWEWFALSPDGTQAAVCAPWPQCGMGEMPCGVMRKIDSGCWTSMAPDNSHRMWVFDVNHREVKIYDRDGKKLGVLDIHRAPGMRGWETYHPRWSNNVRFITMTGPYTGGLSGDCPAGDREIRVHSGGTGIELYIGRLAPDILSVEEWVRVTGNDKADYCGDAWIGG